MNTDDLFDNLVIPSIEEMDVALGIPRTKIDRTPPGREGLKLSSPIISEKMPAPTTPEPTPFVPKQYVEISRGLEATNKEFESLDWDEVLTYITTRKDCYERTSDTGQNRVYVDLDGAMIEGTKEQFDELVENIATTISFGLEEPHSLMTASKYAFGDKNKLSFRLTLLKKHGSKSAVKQYVFKTLVPQLATLLADFVPVCADKECDKTRTYIGVDSSVYAKGRKMRMWNSSKDHRGVSENRPNVLWDEAQSPLDTVITYIPDDSEALPEPVEEKKVVVAPKPKIVDDATDSTGNPVEETDSLAETALLKKVLFGLSPKRADDYEDWLRVGFICFNECVGMEMWDAWSKQSRKYTAGCCVEKWSGFKKGNLTVATLWKWLKADNPALFAELSPQRNDFWTLIKNANHAETAKFFYNLKPDSYVYHEQMKWFQLQPSGVWKHYESVPSGLMSDIWATLKVSVKEHQACLDFGSNDTKEGEKIKALSAFAKNIGTKSFVEGVIAFLPANYNDADLPKKMDESRHLFAFADKAFDLERNEIRPIKPTDFVSLHTGYNFPTASNPTIRAEIQAVLMSIWEDADVVDYVLKVMASNLHGRKKWEEFYVWTGRGGNGKGLITEIVKRAYGDYFHPIPHDCLTKRSDKKDAPNPPIAQAKGKRFVQAQEPEADDKLQIGTIKELTGGDEITARALFRNPVSFVPQFGLFLQCNSVPKLNKLDGGIKRRMVIVNFPFQFVESPSEPHHRRINTDLKDKIAKSDEWRAEFILMLLEAYRSIGSTMVKPAFIREHTEEYLAENDGIKDWLVANYNRGLDPANKRFKLLAEDLRQAFLEETHTNPAEMPASKFKTLMEMNGVSQKREGHSFKGFVWDEDAGDYVEAECRAGSYYLGIERIRN
jgi:P4 family phage/plasmid primase-like protien